MSTFGTALLVLLVIGILAGWFAYSHSESYLSKKQKH